LFEFTRIIEFPRVCTSRLGIIVRSIRVTYTFTEDSLFFIPICGAHRLNCYVLVCGLSRDQPLPTVSDVRWVPPARPFSSADFRLLRSGFFPPALFAGLFACRSLSLDRCGFVAPLPAFVLFSPPLFRAGRHGFFRCPLRGPFVPFHSFAKRLFGLLPVSPLLRPFLKGTAAPKTR